MAVSRATAALPPGSPPTSSASKTASSLSTGTSSRTKRREPSPRAGCRCSVTASPPDRARVVGVDSALAGCSLRLGAAFRKQLLPSRSPPASKWRALATDPRPRAVVMVRGAALPNAPSTDQEPTDQQRIGLLLVAVRRPRSQASVRRLQELSRLRDFAPL